MVLENYIHKIIENCSCNCFVPKKGEMYIEDENLVEYISEYVRKIVKLKDKNCLSVFEEKHKYELIQCRKSKEVTNSCLFLSIAIEIINYFQEKYETRIKEAPVFNLLLKHSIEIYKDLISLLFSGSFDGFFSRFRSLFENYAILKYIKINPELGEIFIDHATIIQCKILNRLKESKSSGLEEKYKALLNKYGDVILEDYGWIFPVVKDKKKRNMKTIIGITDLQGYLSYYKIACEYVHSSSFSVVSNFSENRLFVFWYVLASIELLTNSVIQYMYTLNLSDKEQILIMNLLYFLREELFTEQ